MTLSTITWMTIQNKVTEFGEIKQALELAFDKVDDAIRVINQLDSKLAKISLTKSYDLDILTDEFTDIKQTLGCIKLISTAPVHYEVTGAFEFKDSIKLPDGYVPSADGDIATFKSVKDNTDAVTVKQRYELNPDTNCFTDGYKSNIDTLVTNTNGIGEGVVTAGSEDIAEHNPHIAVGLPMVAKYTQDITAYAPNDLLKSQEYITIANATKIELALKAVLDNEINTAEVNFQAKIDKLKRKTVKHNISSHTTPTRAECITCFKLMTGFDWTNDDDFYIQDTTGTKIVLIKYRANGATDEASAGHFFYESLNEAS